MRLENKIALVTGGASGIGRGIALRATWVIRRLIWRLARYTVVCLLLCSCAPTASVPATPSPLSLSSQQPSPVRPTGTAVAPPTVPTATRTPQAVPTPASVEIDPSVTAAAFGTTTRGWAAQGPKLYRTDDGGITWNLQTTFPVTITELDFASEQYGWALSDDHLYITENGGAAWQQQGSDPIYRVDLLDQQYGWANNLHFTADGGTTWEERTPPCDNDTNWLGDYSFVSLQEGWATCFTEPAVGSQGKMVRYTTNGGQSWQTVSDTEAMDAYDSSKLPSSSYYASFHALDAAHLWLWIGRVDIGGVVRSSDGGQTWMGVKSEPVMNVHKGRFLTPEFGYALSNPFEDERPYIFLFTTNDGGQTWHQRFPATESIQQP